MLYSVQNSGGEVYGIFQLPEEPVLPIGDWEKLLRPELEDILGGNDIRVSELPTRKGPVERVVIDVAPSIDPVQALERAHMAVGSVALTSEIRNR